MIARDSKSYPYLAIAQHYDIPYSQVLKYADLIKQMNAVPPYTEWRLEVWRLEYDTQN